MLRYGNLSWAFILNLLSQNRKFWVHVLLDDISKRQVRFLPTSFWQIEVCPPSKIFTMTRDHPTAINDVPRSRNGMMAMLTTSVNLASINLNFKANEKGVAWTWRHSLFFLPFETSENSTPDFRSAAGSTSWHDIERARVSWFIIIYHTVWLMIDDGLCQSMLVHCKGLLTGWALARVLEAQFMVAIMMIKFEDRNIDSSR